MITLHESNITSFPLDNGLGVLRDAIVAFTEEELNGMFEFYMEYDSEGHLVEELIEERIIKAKAQDKLGYQLFRIYSITKNHENDNLIVNAQHITYDLANNFVEELKANRLTKKQVMEKIGSSTVLPHTFNVTSSNTTTISSTSLYRTNPLQMIAGMEGSVLQIWGGQIERDNFNLILHDRRGHDDGVTVTYEKNITGLEATFDISGLVTRIFPYVFIEATDDEPERLITVTGKYIDSPHINDYEQIFLEPIDYSSDDRIDTQDKTDAQIRQQLERVAKDYFKETGNDKIKVEMDVAFAHLWETEEYKDVKVLELVGMGDTVTTNHSKLKVNATAIVNYIKYDCIAQVNEEVKLGSVKARLTDSINKIDSIEKKVEQADSNANQAIVSANGKNTTFYGPDEPVEGMQKGDLWFKVIDGQYHKTYRYDGIEWQLIIDMDSQEAKQEAQQAKDDAQSAVDRANQATQLATNAISQAQTSFDLAQESLTLGQGLTSRMTDAEGNLTALNQTTQSLAGRLSDAEGNLTTLTATVNGLQTTVSDVQGNVANLTVISSAMQTRLSDVEGNVNTLTLTSQSMQSTISSLQDDWNNLEIGEINLILKSNQSTTSTSYLVKECFISEDFIPGEEYTVVIKGNINSGQVFGLWQNVGSSRRGFFEDIGNGLFTLTFSSSVTTSGNERRVRIYNYPSSGASSATIEWIKLVKANKTSLSWSPAPEDMATQSQITQLSNAINLRVQKGDVLSQINLEAGRTLIDTDKLILSANTTHVTGDFKLDGSAHIKDASIGTAQIGTIDASKISTGTLIGINIQGARFYSTSGQDYMTVIGGEIELVKNNGTYLHLDPDGLYGYNSDGTMRFWLDKTLVTTSAVGTSNANVYLAAIPGGGGGEARVVNYNDIPGDGLVDSYRYLPLRASGFYGNYLNVNPAVPGGASNVYVRPLSGGELRVTLSESTTNYQNLRADWLYGNRMIVNGLHGKQNHFYLGTLDGGELRVVNNDSNSNYRAIRASGFFGEFIDRTASTSGAHIYVRPAGDPGELRVTVRGTTNTYRPVAASDFRVRSSRTSKENIKPINKSGLVAINELEIVEFNYKNENMTRTGFIAEDSPSIASDGEFISLAEVTALLTKATQEIDEKANYIDQRLEEFKHAYNNVPCELHQQSYARAEPGHTKLANFDAQGLIKDLYKQQDKLKKEIKILKEQIA